MQSQRDLQYKGTLTFTSIGITIKVQVSSSENIIAGAKFYSTTNIIILCVWNTFSYV